MTIEILYLLVILLGLATLSFMVKIRDKRKKLTILAVLISFLTMGLTLSSILLMKAIVVNSLAFSICYGICTTINVYSLIYYLIKVSRLMELIIKED